MATACPRPRSLRTPRNGVIVADDRIQSAAHHCTRCRVATDTTKLDIIIVVNAPNFIVRTHEYPGVWSNCIAYLRLSQSISDSHGLQLILPHGRNNLIGCRVAHLNCYLRRVGIAHAYQKPRLCRNIERRLRRRRLQQLLQRSGGRQQRNSSNPCSDKLAVFHDHGSFPAIVRIAKIHGLEIRRLRTRVGGDLAEFESDWRTRRCARRWRVGDAYLARVNDARNRVSRYSDIFQIKPRIVSQAGGPN